MTENAEPLIRLKARIISQQMVGLRTYRLVIEAPALADAARPGQFLEILTGDEESADPLLRRPFSLYSIDKRSGSVSVVYRVAGKGTRQLSQRTSGEKLDIFGPVGNGFQLSDKMRRILLVAGGIGMPPLHALAQAYPDREYLLYYGARTAKDLILLEDWQKLGITVHLATDDGSLEFAGLVTDRLKIETPASFDLCCACGPRPMLRTLYAYIKNEGIPGLFSLEERMACGVGACLGCVCKTVAGYRRVCVDGPVFPAEEVVWE